jgi:chitinase
VEVFKQGDARTVVDFAKEKKLAWLGFWSMGRDNGNCAGVGIAQATCSSIQQGPFEFARIFGGFTG